MKRLSIFAMVLTVLATMTTLTGCMSNEEPEGITQLRSAKSDYIKAQTALLDADYQLKVIQLESAKINVLTDSIDLEIKKLDLAKQTAQNEYDLQEIQNKKDALAETFKAQLLALQEATSKAQLSYNTAKVNLEIAVASSRDEAFITAIEKAQTSLDGAFTDMKTKQEDLMTAKNALITYNSGNKYYLSGEQRKLDAKNNEITLKNSFIAEVALLAGQTTVDYKSQIAAKQAEIDALAASITKIKAEIVTMKEAIAPITAAISKLEAEQSVSSYLTIATSSVDGEMHNDLYNALKSVSLNPALDLTTAFKEGADKEYDMVASFTYSTKLSGLEAVSKAIIAQLNTKVNSAYNNTFSPQISTLTDDLKDYQVVQMKDYYANTSLDLQYVETAYNKAKTEWLADYSGYNKAVASYNSYASTNPYEAIKAKVDAYVALDPSLKTIAAAKALQAQIAAYGVLRDSLDYAMPGTVSYTPSGATAPITAKYYQAQIETTVTSVTTPIISLADFNANVATYLPASQEWSKVPTAGVKNGWVARLVAANTALFGSTEGNSVLNVIAPVNGDVPADAPKSGAYGAYQTATTASIFKNIDKWVALIANVKAQGDTANSAIVALDVQIAAQKAQIATQEDAIWKKEFDAKLIDFAFTPDKSNPYTSSVVESSTTKAILTAQLSVLTAASKEEGKFNIVVPDATNGGYVVESKNAAEYLETLKDELETLQKAAEAIQLNIDLFNQVGYNSTDYVSSKEAAIAQAQLAYDAAVKEVADRTAVVNALISAQ